MKLISCLFNIKSILIDCVKPQSFSVQIIQEFQVVLKYIDLFSHFKQNFRVFFNGNLQILFIFSFFHRPKSSESIRESVSVESLRRHLPIVPGGSEAGARGLLHHQHHRPEAEKEEELNHYSGKIVSVILLELY